MTIDVNKQKDQKNIWGLVVMCLVFFALVVAIFAYQQGTGTRAHVEIADSPKGGVRPADGSLSDQSP